MRTSTAVVATLSLAFFALGVCQCSSNDDDSSAPLNPAGDKNNPTFRAPSDENGGASTGGGTSMGSGGAPSSGDSHGESNQSGMPSAMDAGQVGSDSTRDGGAPSADASAPDAETASCTNIDQSKPLVLYQSADDSNSMASPVIARSRIRHGGMVPTNILRTYEFLNYYSIQYQAPEPGHVNIVPQMIPGDKPGEYTLQIGVQSEKREGHRPMAITFVLDNSGSMAGSPISLERDAVKAIAGSMKAGDIVSMVTWNTTQSVLLDNLVVDGPNDPRLLTAASKLQADGSTDLQSGLKKGYELARKAYNRDKLNRVVLISDGQANTGVTDEQLIAKESHHADGEGIYLVGVGVGDGVNDTLMDVVTDKGRGAYVYLDSSEEAQNVFGPRFNEVMEVAARDVRLELTLPWYFQLKATSAEQSSTRPEEVEPQYLAPNDALIFVNKLRPCDPSVVNPADTIQAKVTYKLPISQTPGEDSATKSIQVLQDSAGPELRKGAAIVAYAEALKCQSECRGVLEQALNKVRAANDKGDDRDLKEIDSLLVAYMTRSFSK